MKSKSSLNLVLRLLLIVSATLCGGCTQAWRENAKKPTLIFRPVARASAVHTAKRFLAAYTRDESPRPYKIHSVINWPDQGEWKVTFTTGFVDDFVFVGVEEKTGCARISKMSGYVLHGPQNEFDPAQYLSLSDFTRQLAAQEARRKRRQ